MGSRAQIHDVCEATIGQLRAENIRLGALADELASEIIKVLSGAKLTATAYDRLPQLYQLCRFTPAMASLGKPTELDPATVTSRDD